MATKERQTVPHSSVPHTTALLIPKIVKEGKGKKDLLNRDQSVQVHFNPETLNIAFTSNIQKGRKKQPSKVTSETTAKLSMELIFDTTMPEDGKAKDVRIETNKIVQFMDPAQISPRSRSSDESKTPFIVVFQWGAIWFEGYIDSLTEKIELFSSNGIPLRATVSISMTQQKRSYDPKKEAPDAVGLGDNPPTLKVSQKKSITDIAQAAGDITGTRRLGTKNGVEDLRHPEVDELVIADHIRRQPPGITPGRAGRPGASPSGPPGSTESLFAKLHSQPNPAQSLVPRQQLSVEVGSLVTDQVGIGSNTAFGLGGEVDTRGSASIYADVGVGADFKLGILFEE